MPNVGAVPPPITSNRNCLEFNGWIACSVLYSGSPIIVQVAPVSKSAKVDVWLIVIRINQRRQDFFSAGVGVFSRSHGLSNVLTSLFGVEAVAWGRVG